MEKQLKPEDAVEKIRDCSSLMIGGFLGASVPLKLIDQVVQKKIKGLTVISVGAGYRGGGIDIGKLVINRQIKKFITSHVGTDPNLIEQIVSGEVTLELSPMGTFIERIRASGAGLGAVVSPVGFGTEVEAMADGKLTIDDQDYLLFKPISADVAIIKAHRCDQLGNLQYKGISSTNPVMATAAEIVIAEVDEIVEVGEIDSESIGTPGIFVDYYVQGYSFKKRCEIYEGLWVADNKI